MSNQEWWVNRYSETGLPAYMLSHGEQTAQTQTQLEVTALDELITTHKPDWKNNPILDVAGGMGRHAAGFITQGCNHVTVLDQSLPFLKMGQEMAIKAGLVGRINFVKGDARSIHTLGMTFPTITCLGNSVLGYSTRREDDEAFLHSVSQSLDPKDGLFLLDVQDGERMRQQYSSPQTEVKFSQGHRIATTRHFSNGRIEVQEEITSGPRIVSTANFSMRPYSEQEVFGMLQAAGFTSYSNGHSIVVPGATGTMANRMLYIARKNE